MVKIPVAPLPPNGFFSDKGTYMQRIDEKLHESDPRVSLGWVSGVCTLHFLRIFHRVYYFPFKEAPMYSLHEGGVGPEFTVHLTLGG